MTYLFSSGAQIRIFLSAVGFGFFLGAVYDGFRILRLLFQKTDRAYRVSDLLFSVTAGFLVFLFVLTTLNGQIRGYVLLGILLGFLLVCAISVSLSKNLLNSILIFMSYSLVMSVIWILLESPDLAITEAAVGAGVTTVLFFVTLKKIHAISREEDDNGTEE